MSDEITPDPQSPGRSASDQPITSFGDVAPHYEHLMSTVPYRFWVSYLDRLWNLHSLPRKRVLDLACGTGTVSRMLASRGHDVVGVDLSGRMLEIARRMTAEEGLAIEYVEQDAAEMSLPGRSFETVISLFDSLNYILDPQRLAMAFNRVYAHLDPGGSFIFDLNTEYAFEQGMFNQSCTRRDEPLHYRWRSRYNDETRICTVNMSFSFDRGNGLREQFKEVHRQRAYSKTEVASFLADAGFTGVTVYDAYSTDPPNPRSDRVFYLALRPE
jgi:SAM-dependent methyltransferase